VIIEVQIERTDRNSGQIGIDKAQLAIRKDEKGIHIRLIGGETGFEGFSIAPHQTLEIGDWLACAGRRFEYDQVLVPAKEMRRAFQAAGVVVESEIDYESVFDEAAKEVASSGWPEEHAKSERMFDEMGLRETINALHKIFNGKLKK
jgi:hypothetical protein